MSNGLLDVMKYCADEKVKSANIPHYVSGVITSVSEDMFRADIKLEQDQVLKNMLNKSGEELEVGDTVWVEYFTYPSSGWIARRNGKPKPMGGGGAATTVENAAVLLGNEFHDYLINETLMLSIQPPTAIYYGANMDDPDDHARSFVVVQGHYCTRSWSGSRASMVVYDSQTGKFTIGGADGLFEAIIANRDKFGTIYGDDNGGGFFRFSGNTDTYPKTYRTAYYEFTSSSMETKVVSGVNETATSYQAKIYTPTYNTTARTGNWWEVGVNINVSSKNIGSGSQRDPIAVDNTRNFYGSITDIFMVPNITSYGNSYPENRPFGYVTVDGFYIFAKDENLEWGVVYWPYESSSQWLTNVPLVSRAEQYFLLGVSKKTEPQTT